jgi:gamma-glutamylcyclotransferase (GGCT)/AIG2-like uncharacterized protein YtfP
MVGRVRWPILQPYVLEGPTEATVPGRIFDTGLDFPAARFDLAGTVHGELFRVDARALPLLDEVEGAAHGLYRRVVVTTGAGQAAWSYEFGGDVDDFLDLDGRWTGP